MKLLKTLSILLAVFLAGASPSCESGSEPTPDPVEEDPVEDPICEPTEALRGELSRCQDRIDIICEAIETRFADAMVPSAATIQKDFSEVCGISVRIDHLDTERGWVHLAYRSGGQLRYGHRMVLDEAKHDRNVLMIRDQSTVILLDTCGAETCEIRCLTMFQEVPACGTSLLPLE